MWLGPAPIDASISARTIRPTVWSQTTGRSSFSARRMVSVVFSSFFPFQARSRDEWEWNTHMGEQVMEDHYEWFMFLFVL